MERNKEKRLGKSRADKKITGVCGGIAAYLGLSPKSVRILCLGCVCCFQMESLHIYCLRQCFLFQTVKMQGDKKGEKKWGKYWQ